MTGRSSSVTHSRPSTLGWAIASVNGSRRPCWISHRMVRTGSWRAQPRSLAGAGTTAPCSGHVRGRGMSHRQPRRTRRTSLTTSPTARASCMGPRSPLYQGIRLLLDFGQQDRRHAHVRHARMAADGLLGHLERILERGRALEAEAMDDLAVAADDDDVARVLHRMRGPIPRVERVGAVVRVRLAVELPEPWVLGETQLVFGLDLDRLRRVGQDLVVEVDVARVLDGVELVAAGVREDGHSPLSEHWLVSVEIEQIAQPHADDQHRVHRRVDVVRPEVRHADRDDVGLALDAYRDLIADGLERFLMHRVDLARVDAGQAVRRAHGMEDVALERRRREVGELLHAQEHRLVLRGPVGFALLHEVGDGRKSVVVDRGLDMEDAHRVFDELTLTYTGMLQRGVRRVHVRA